MLSVLRSHIYILCVQCMCVIMSASRVRASNCQYLTVSQAEFVTSTIVGGRIRLSKHAYVCVHVNTYIVVNFKQKPCLFLVVEASSAHGQSGGSGRHLPVMHSQCYAFVCI